jgi:DNA-binding transcriptional regulator GbsR (MarR family)
MATAETSQLTEFEAKTIPFFVEAASVLGVPKSVAMIYGVLFGSAQPLTFAEIEQKLNLSKGSVSQGLRFLRDIGAVSVASVESPSVRTEQTTSNAVRYEPVVELRVLLNRLVAEKVLPHLKASGEAIETLSDHLPDQSDEAEILETRLKHLRAWQRRTRDLLPILKAIL